MEGLRKIRRALISVSDKTGLAEFAKTLCQFGVEIISTGGTAKTLRDNDITVTEVSEVTGFPKMLDGRVKTLHPKIHGAILGLRDNEEHISAMQKHGIEPIDLVVVNLYPFEQTIARENVSLEEAVENIDIGGPAMIRSAAKNWRDVAVVTDPAAYENILSEMKETGGALTLQSRQNLAYLAYTRTSAYDQAISSYLTKQLEPAAATDFCKHKTIELTKIADLRYGENPHQKAALYYTNFGGIAAAEQLRGKEMSFNNFVDAEAAWNLVQDFDELAVAIIKHTNPSGVGIGATNEEAYRRALSTDPVSAFGGIVAFNRKVDAAVATSINEIFTEVVIAPEFEPQALDILQQNKNLRVLRRSEISNLEFQIEYKQISGGMLVQTADKHKIAETDLQIVTKKQPRPQQIRAMLYAWKVCKHVKSNAIVLADESRTIGVGAGQMNRLDSIRIAAMRAERFDLPLRGCVLASDAFFPFRDNVDEAAKLGVAAIIQPGGSVKDAESIAAADEHSIAMAFTGIRHFKH